MAAKQVIGVLLSLASAWFLHFLYRLYKNRRWFNGLVRLLPKLLFPDLTLFPAPTPPQPPLGPSKSHG
jgi:hypothetical protein